MLLCGFVNFMVGPSLYLPNNVVIMGFGIFFNNGLEVFFMVTCLPVMIKEGEKMYPKNKIEVADKASGIVNCMFGLGQALGSIYGSYMTAYFGFRNTADSIVIILIVYSLIYICMIKYFEPHSSNAKSDNDNEKQLKL